MEKKGRYTASDVAKEFKVSEATVRTKMRNGEIKFYEEGAVLLGKSRKYIPSEEMERLRALKQRR